MVERKKTDMSKKEMINALEELQQEMLNPEMMMEKYNIDKEGFYAWMYGWVSGSIDHILEHK